MIYTDTGDATQALQIGSKAVSEKEALSMKCLKQERRSKVNREITITIDKDTWEVDIEASGYVGGSCIKEIDKIHELIGESKVINRRLKPEVVMAEKVVLKR